MLNMKKAVSLILFLIAIFCSFPGQALSAVLLDRVVATVNDEVITWSELMKVITMEGKAFLTGISEELKKERIKELERPFLNKLIEMKLQLQEADKMGLAVGGAELESAISEIKVKFGMTEEVFMNSLRAEGLTMKDYKSRLSNQILLQKVVNYAVKVNIVVSDREIEEYYEMNKENFTGKEKFKIRQIFFGRPDDESLKTAIEEKARDIYQRIVAGDDFAKLASEFSEGPTRQYGGDLGYVSKGSILKEIEDEAFALNTGEASKPFWSPAGLHIIKLEDRVEGGSLEKVRDKVKEIIYQQTFESKYNSWRTGLRENAYVEIAL